MTDQFLTVAQTADYLSRHPETVRAYIRRGLLRPTRIGQRGAYLISKRDLDRMLERNAERLARRHLSWSSQLRLGATP